MKSLKLYITEALHVNRNTKTQTYNYHPKTTDDLRKLVKKLIKERGENADLNDIDTSEITNMSYLFYDSNFNGDISKWDVSNVTNMTYMFFDSKFNGDISKWDVSNVKFMIGMLMYTKFNGDISGWNINKECRTNVIFDGCPLEKNPPKWYKK